MEINESSELLYSASAANAAKWVKVGDVLKMLSELLLLRLVSTGSEALSAATVLFFFFLLRSTVAYRVGRTSTLEE